MKTAKKQVKFSKGEVNQSLIERTDISLLNSSASYISNYIATLYGGIKTRQGTLDIDSILSSLVPKETTFVSSIGGDVADIGSGFVSTTINGATLELHGDLSTSDVYENITINNIKLSFEDGAVSATDTAGVIDATSIDLPGKGYKDITLTVVGDGIDAVLTPTLATDGSIASIAITNGGTGYTSYTVEITENDVWTDTQTLEISVDNAIWTKVADFEITRLANTLSYPIVSSYRYVRLSRDGSSITTCLELLDFVIYDKVDAENRVRMADFVFSEDEKYALIFTNETVRVYQDDILIETIPAVGLLDDYFKRLKFTQAEDTMILTHPNMPPKQLIRGLDATTNTIIPEFGAGETTKDGYTISADSSNPYKVWDLNTSTYSTLGEYLTEMVRYLEGGYPTTYDHLLPNNFICDFDGAKDLKRITFRAKDMSQYEVYTKDNLGNYTLQKGGVFSNTPSETKDITVNLDVNCYGYKIYTYGVKVNTRVPRVVAEPDSYKSEWYPVKMYDSRTFESVNTLFSFDDFELEGIPYYNYDALIKTNPAVSITPSSADGSGEITASGSIFTIDSVGQYINTDLGSRFKITSYISGTKVSGYTIIPFLNTSAIGSQKWEYEAGYELVWSEERGYPLTCLFYQQRLWFGGSKGRPQTIWGSRINQYHSFENIGQYDNDAIEAPIAAKETNEIVNLYDNRGLQIFTGGAEYIANDSSLTPSNIFITKTTPNGSLSNLAPVSVGGVTLFLEKNGKSLLSFVYNEVQANYITDNISLLSSHLIANPLRLAVDYNSNNDNGNYLYMAKEDGELLVSNILLDQKINAFTRINTAGLVKDVMVLKSDTYLLVERLDVLYLEKLADVKTDCSLIKAPTLTITGLEKFEDLEVRAYNDIDYGLYTVENGEITLNDTPTEPVIIGEDIPCQLRSNPVYISNETTSIYKRISKAILTTKDTTSIILNGDVDTSDDNIFEFFSVSGYERENKFTITSTFDNLELLSVMLHINYGD